MGKPPVWKSSLIILFNSIFEYDYTQCVSGLITNKYLHIVGILYAVPDLITNSLAKRCILETPLCRYIPEHEVYTINTQLPSGCEPIDKMLGGGFESGVITQIFGEAGSGKTNICLQLAVQCVRNGKKAVLIDTEAISPERFRQIAGEDAKEIAQNIIIYEPHDFEEQYAAVHEVEKICSENIGLIIVDSATSFYRFGLDDDETSIRNRRELANQIGYLHALARKYGLVVVITNQVYSDVNSGSHLPIGGTSLEHISKTIIQLERMESRAGKRRAKLWKHRSRPEGEICEFTITGEGIR
ncbi:MAG: DNA repair and recombination protein RadB [Methanosarcinaceae archaeon]|nr:DNA repair and recombination protein RadB [Methanosarcinaceae archaeon]